MVGERAGVRTAGKVVITVPGEHAGDLLGGDQAAGVRETHSAIVLLFGDRAYKIKKPVDLGFLDFRSVQARSRVTRRELDLNRRLAPDVYLDVGALSGSDGHAYEHVLVMHRMPEACRLSTLVREGRPVELHLRGLARLMARFHAGADRSPQIAAQGGADALVAPPAPPKRRPARKPETGFFCSLDV
jgi:aminoglycoside phosphotransferase family enzyme